MYVVFFPSVKEVPQAPRDHIGSCDARSFISQTTGFIFFESLCSYCQKDVERKSNQWHYQEQTYFYSNVIDIIMDDAIKIHVLIRDTHCIIRIVKEGHENTFLPACKSASAFIHLADASAYFNFVKCYLCIFAGPLVPGDEFLTFTMFGGK